MGKDSSIHCVGLISDTHGLLRPEALAALRGSELILHAGDVGQPFVLDDLGTVAPVVAVRGNIDRVAPLDRLPFTQTVEVGGRYLYILHDVNQLDVDPGAGGFSAVISGHSHRQLIEERRGVLYVNPGAAGPRRFSLPVTVAKLWVSADGLRAEIVPLK